MIRFGIVCGACRPGECRDNLGEHVIECPGCHGQGCDHCDGGKWTVAGCPQRFVGGMEPLIRLIEMTEQGLWPVQGGSLDQAAYFVDAARQYKSDVAEIKASKGAK